MLLDVHAFELAAVPLPISCVVAPWQMDDEPVIVGKALTVTEVEAEHPLASMYIMVLVPAATPVTTPVEAFTVAIVVEDALQGNEDGAVLVPVKVMVEPAQTLFPEEGEMVGDALTVIIVEAWQPLASV